jgi:hypothetical protein
MTEHLRSISPSDTAYLGYAKRIAVTRSRLLYAIHTGDAWTVNCITSGGGVDVNAPGHRLPPPPHQPTPTMLLLCRPLLAR